MSVLANLTQRNRAFAATHPVERPALEPNLKVVILYCADHRADPAQVFGLKPKRSHRLKSRRQSHSRLSSQPRRSRNHRAGGTLIQRT